MAEGNFAASMPTKCIDHTPVASVSAAPASAKRRRRPSANSSSRASESPTKLPCTAIATDSATSQGACGTVIRDSLLSLLDESVVRHMLCVRFARRNLAFARGPRRAGAISHAVVSKAVARHGLLGAAAGRRGGLSFPAVQFRGQADPSAQRLAGSQPAQAAAIRQIVGVGAVAHRLESEELVIVTGFELRVRHE